MNVLQVGTSRWMHQVAGVVLAGVAIIGLSQPTAKATMHCLEDAAVYRLAPTMERSEIGRQILAVYVKRDGMCHRTISTTAGPSALKGFAMTKAKKA